MIKYFFNIYRLIPLTVIYEFLKQEINEIDLDIAVWKSIKKINKDGTALLIYLMLTYKEYRNLFLYRIKKHRLCSLLIRFLFKQEETLHLQAKSIGGGLFIQHGFATIVVAERIGNNCWINQQVTVGWASDNSGCPIIGDNVKICCGAKVLGGITVGSNSIIGANAVVVKNVNENTVMGGVPAKVIKLRN